MTIKESSLKNLKPNKSHWNNSETVTIRIPKILKDKVIEYAKKLDNKNESLLDKHSTVTQELKILLEKINSKEKGYKNNSASRLINELKLIEESLD